MKNKKKDFEKIKLNVCLTSIVVIFIGAVLYVPAFWYAENKKEVVYYQIPIIDYYNKPLNFPETILPEFPMMDENIENEIFMEELETEEAPKIIITKNLKFGDVDEEVRELQKFLNSNGFLVAETGPGSPGRETAKFGFATKDAVIRFQEANADTILKPFGLTYGTGVVGELTKDLINSY